MTTDLHRTNINLYTSDVTYLRATYGFGWTERVREAVASYVRNQKLIRTNPPAISRRYVDNTEVPDNE